MEQTLIDEIIYILEEFAIQDEFDGIVKVPKEDVAKEIEKLVVVKLNYQKRQLMKGQK
jgi:hypothetical protein